METIKINETPVRTSRNFNINNIKIKDVLIPKKIDSFENTNILNDSSKINIENINTACNLKFGLGELLTNQVITDSNQNYRITINSKTNKETEIDFSFDKNNLNLVDNIEIYANEDTRGTIILKYRSDNDLKCFHNGIIKLFAKKNSKIDVISVSAFTKVSISISSLSVYIF